MCLKIVFVNLFVQIRKNKLNNQNSEIRMLMGTWNRISNHLPNIWRKRLLKSKTSVIQRQNKFSIFSLSKCFFFSCRTSTKTSSITSGTSRISPTYRIPQSQTRICPIRISNPFSCRWRRTRSKQFCQSSSQWTTWPWTTSSPNLWNSKIIRCGIRRSFRYY